MITINIIVERFVIIKNIQGNIIQYWYVMLGCDWSSIRIIICIGYNVASNIEQVLAATPHKAPTTHTHTHTHIYIYIYIYIYISGKTHAHIYIYIYIYIYISRKLSKLDEPDLQVTAGEVGDEHISDVLLWIPTYSRAKAGQPVRTYIQLLCEDTGCGPEDLPEAMNDREKWRERVRDIRACCTT